VEEIIYTAVAIIIGIGAFILGKNINRGTISDPDDSIGKLRQGVGESRKTNIESGKITGLIKQANSSARAGIRTALEILRGIEKTDPDKKD
jgi:hypothetical protein